MDVATRLLECGDQVYAAGRYFSSLLGQRLDHFVSDPEAIQSMLEKWKNDRSTPLSWDFGSWIDALASAEILYQTFYVHPDGSGELSFEQLAWPSGGIEATEELIKIFGGRVTSNSAA